MSLIATDRLIIRELCLDDLEAFYMFSRERSMKDWIPDQVYSDIEEANEVIEFLISKYTDDLTKVGYPYVMALVLKDTDKLIGHVGLSAIPEGIEIGYAIGEHYQKKGYATEAVQVFTDWAKHHLNLDTIYAIVKSKNIGSCKTLEKTGFQFLKEEDRESFGVVYRQKVYNK